MTAAEPRSILRRPAVRARTGLSNTRIDVLERARKFPQRVRISERACGWYSDEVDAWINGRPRAIDAPPDIGADPCRRGVGRKAKADQPTADPKQ